MTSQSVNSADASDTQLIVFPPDRGIGVLAVVPPYPVGFKPQTDGALGININLVHGDRDGLLVYILAYTDMSVGDTISVYIESKNAPVAKFSVTDAHFDAQGIAKNIPFYISAKIMESRFAPLQKQNKDFWFEVQRISGNSEGSPPVPLFYKYPAPGEADTDGGKPFNQGLKLPVASESVVDKTVIDEGMFVTVLEYFNQHIGDVVVLAFGSLLLETTVTELGDVLFELLPEQLTTLAPTNSLVVRWEVFDVVENASGWSDSLILTFKPGVVLLTAPIFEQADADNVLHHDRLIGGAANVLVTGVFSTSDVIDLTLQGFTKSGDPVIHIYSQTLAGSSRAVSFSFENERVRNLIGGTVRASYTLTRASKAQQSKPADATIAGTSLPLGAPIITPLVDGKLPVDTVTATVQVADYWPLKSSAKVELRWQTTDQDGITTLFIFALIVTDPTQPVVFKVPARYIAPYAGAPLTVQNTITNPGQVEVFSELAQLMFGEDMKLNLLPPTVIGQSGNNFSPTQPEIRVLVPQGPLLPPDKLSVTWAGAIAVPAASYTSPQRLVSAGLEIAVPRSVLAYSLGKTVTVTYTVERNGVSTTSPPLTLNILPLPTTALNPPKIVEADASNVLDIVALGTKNATIHALLHTLIETGQHCWLSLFGKKADGTAQNLTLMSGYPAKVNDTWVSQGFWPAALANSYLKQLGHGTTLTIKYKVALDKSNLEANAVVFPERVYTVKAALDLKAPRIKEAPNNTSLDPLAAKDTLTALIPSYDNMIGTQLNVSFIGTAGSGSQTVGPINVTTQGEQSIPLSNAVLAFNLGKTVTVTYIVTRGGVPLNPSDPLVLTVLRIADANPAMGMPLITQAANNGAGPEFNVSALTTNATMRVNSWPLIALKQFVWLFLIGTKADGSAYTRTFWQPGSQTNSSWISNGFYTHPLPIAEAKALKDDSLLRLVFKVGLGGSQLESEAVTFAERVYTIKAVELMIPTLTNVLDDKGVEVLEAGFTVSTSLTLKGAASKGLQVEIFDGSGASAVSKGKATADKDTGLWSLTITVPVGARRLYAKSLYHSTSVYSNVRILTVVAATAPTITTVKGSPSGADIPNGTTTSETAVVLTGTASKGQKVDVLDGTVSQGQPTANVATGVWTQPVSGLTNGPHSFTAKALYGAQPVSVARTLTVQIIPTLNPGPNKALNLVNFIVAQARPPVYVPAEAIYTQAASGGQPPYTYASNNSGVASVAAGGTVTCRNNGDAVITVTDSRGTKASYTLTVKGIRTLLQNDATWRTWPEAYNYCVARGGRLATVAEMSAFYNLYAREARNVAALLGWPLIQTHPHSLFGAWILDGNGAGAHYYFNVDGTPSHGGGGVLYGLHADGNRRPALCLYG